MLSNDVLAKLPADPSDLLSDEEHRVLNEALAELANLRRRVASDCGHARCYPWPACQFRRCPP